MLHDQATLTFNGRAIFLEPAELGEQLFEKLCTITLMESAAPSAENNWRRGPEFVAQREFWYTNHPTTGQRLFCTHRGFAAAILARLRERGVTVHLKDTMPSGIPTPDFEKVRGITWRGRQAEILIKILASINGGFGGVLDCPTGWGKTFLLAQICKLYPTIKIGIVEPGIDIAREVIKGLQGYFRVGQVGGGKKDVQRVTVAVDKSIKYLPQDLNLLIFDECHVAPAEGNRTALMGFPRAVFLGVTASPEGRSDRGDKYLQALFGEVIDHVGYQEAVEGGNVVQLTVIQVPVRKGPNVSSYSRMDIKKRIGLWLNEQRNHAIKWAVEDAHKRCGGSASQILIMVETTAHAYALKRVLPEFTVVTGEVDDERAAELASLGLIDGHQTGPEVTDVEYQGLCTKKDRERYKAEFSAGTLRFVICTMVWSKGVNFLDLPVLIRGDGTTSKIISTQVPGRLSRLGSDGMKGGALLYDFTDEFSPDLKRGAQSRFASYGRNGWKIIKLP